MVKCKHCGRWITEQTISCPYCGIPQNRKMKTKKKKNKTTKIITVVGLIFVLCLICCLFCINYFSKKQIKNSALNNDKTDIFSNEYSSEDIADSINNNTKVDDGSVYTLRDTSWGMTLEEVKGIEKSIVSYTLFDEIISYLGDFHKHPVSINYLFDSDGKLYAGNININETFAYDQEYIDNFENIQRILINMYGNPTKTDDENDSVNKRFSWEKNNSSVVHMMIKNNDGSFMHTIGYFSPENNLRNEKNY